MREETLVRILNRALEGCYDIKEHYVSECDFDSAARFRDYADTLKKIIAGVVGTSDLIMLRRSKKPLNECRHLELNQKKSEYSITEETCDVRHLLDLEAQDMGFKDYEDMELSIIREVGECGPNCVWWGWRSEIISTRETKGKSLIERQPDWKPEDLVIPFHIRKAIEERNERKGKG